MPYKSGFVTTTALSRNISEVETKIPDSSSLMTITIINTKIGKVK